jgi:hypothetical protein
MGKATTFMYGQQTDAAKHKKDAGYGVAYNFAAKETAALAMCPAPATRTNAPLDQAPLRASRSGAGSRRRGNPPAQGRQHASVRTRRPVLEDHRAVEVATEDEDPPALTPDQVAMAQDALKVDPKHTVAGVARSLGVSPATLHRALQRAHAQPGTPDGGDGHVAPMTLADRLQIATQLAHAWLGATRPAHRPSVWLGSSRPRFDHRAKLSSGPASRDDGTARGLPLTASRLPGMTSQQR